MLYEKAVAGQGPVVGGGPQQAPAGGVRPEAGEEVAREGGGHRPYRQMLRGVVAGAGVGALRAQQPQDGLGQDGRARFTGGGEDHGGAGERVPVSVADPGVEDGPDGGGTAGGGEREVQEARSGDVDAGELRRAAQDLGTEDLGDVAGRAPGGAREP